MATTALRGSGGLLLERPAACHSQRTSRLPGLLSPVVSRRRSHTSNANEEQTNREREDALRAIRKNAEKEIERKKKMWKDERLEDNPTQPKPHKRISPRRLFGSRDAETADLSPFTPMAQVIQEVRREKGIP